MQNQSEVKVTFVDNPMAPEVFVSEVTGYFINSGVMRVAFASARVNHETSPGPINRIVNLRLVMPVVVAQALAVGLYDFLKRQGVPPPDLPPPPTPASISKETLQ